MTGNGFLARVGVCVRPIWTLLARLLKWDRRPSEEVQELKQHLERASNEDVKLRSQSRRKEKLLRDNHLVSDVERALRGLGS